MQSVVDQQDQMRFTQSTLKSPKKLVQTLEKRVVVLERIEKAKNHKETLKQKHMQK